MTTAPASPTDQIPPAWRRSGTIAGACAALFAVALFLYAGGTWQIVLHELLSDGIISIAWIASAFGLGSMVLWTMDRRDSADASCSFSLIPHVTSVALGLGMMSILILSLGLLGALNRATAVGLLAIGMAGCGLAYRRKQFDAIPSTVHAVHWFWLLAIPFLAIAVMAVMVPPGMLWQPSDPHGYDVVSYHLQIPREWFEAGKITALQHNVFSYFPFNIEMHYLLAMQIRGGAWSGMYLAQMMHLWFIVLTVMAIGSAAGPVAGAACAAIPWLAMLGGVAYNEGGLLLFGTLAIIWAIRAINGEGKSRLCAVLIAGLLAGFACGSKYTGVVVVVGGIVAGLLVVLRWRAIVPVCLFVSASVLTFSPWLARNTTWAGNPVFPEAMPIFDQGHFSDTQAERWRRAHSPTAAESGILQRIARARERIILDPQFGYVLVPAGILAIGLARNRAAAFLAVLLVVHAVFWLGFTHLQSRFFVSGIPIAALLAGSVEWRGFRRVFAGLVVVGAVVSFGQLHSVFIQRMETAGRVVGLEQLDVLLPVEVDSNVIPDTRTLLLVGDAAAFYYPTPMSRLRYRTVFDVDAEPGQDAVEAWTRGWPADEPMLIMPSELVRFSNTYWGIPAPSAEIAARPMPYLVRPAGGGGTGSP
jgi:hypothetical protein